MMSGLVGMWAIIWKDLTAERRSRELVSSMLVFALLVLLIFNFALELDLAVRESVTAGVLWATFTFSGTIGLNRSMSSERDRGCFEGLLLAPINRSVIYFGKFIGNLIFMLLVEAIVLPVYSFLYQVNLFQGGFFLTLLLGSIGYAAVGTLLAVMVVQVRTRDILLPILLFPLVLPVLIAAVKASQGVLQGLVVAELATWLNILAVYDLVFIVLTWLLFDYVVEES